MKIKNQFKRLVAVACLAATTAGIAGAASWRENILVDVNKVTVVSNQKTIQEPTLLWNDKTYIPLRATLEAAGCQVDWDQSTYTATVSNRYAALADVLYQSYQYSYILFDYYRIVSSIQTINTWSVDKSENIDYEASLLLDELVDSINWYSEYLDRGIYTLSLYLNESGWSYLLPDFQAIYQEMLDIHSQFKELATDISFYKTNTISEINDIAFRSAKLLIQLRTAQNMISNYYDKVSNQMVYNVPIY